MDFFIDTANLDEIKKASELGLVDGVTTNPSLVAKEGCDFKTRIREICELVNGPVSAEVIATTAPEMIKEAKELSEIAPNVVVKIPMTTEGLKAARELSSLGIQTNVTLVFSPLQALLAAKAGATYVSPFVGRLDDISHDGMELVRDIAAMIEYYDFNTQVIAASIRHPLHVIEAMRAGAQIATVPYDVLVKMVKHPLTEAGIKKFYEDYQQIPKG